MRLHKLISILLHPIVIPTIGMVCFLALTKDRIPKQLAYFLLSVIFVTTYLVPLLFLFILKRLKLIQNFQVSTISERKIPLFIMLIIFTLLGRTLITIPIFQPLGILFHGTNIALIVVYLLFFLKIKTSLHVISMSSLFMFFLMYCTLQAMNALPVIIPLLLLTGLLASSRLCLKAHTPKEVYIGFFVGIGSQCIAFMFL